MASTDEDSADVAQEHHEEDAARIRHFLIRLRDQRDLLSAYFHDHGHNDTFATLLLDVHPADDEIVLDQLNPAFGERLAEVHQAFEVLGQVDGISIRFAARLIRHDVDDGLTCHVARLPSSITLVQRRDAFRIHTPAHPQCRAVISTEEGDSIDGFLVDLSVSGVGFRVRADQAPELAPGMRFDARIVMPDAAVTTQMEIRFNKALEGRSIHRIGARFMGLDTQDRRRIERYVFQLQRRQLKN